MEYGKRTHAEHGDAGLFIHHESHDVQAFRVQIQFYLEMRVFGCKFAEDMRQDTTDISAAGGDLRTSWRPSIIIDRDGVLRLVLPDTASGSLAVAALRYFDDDMSVVPGMEAELPAFIEQARRIDPRFFVSPDAMYAILEERDSRRRAEVLSRTADAAIESLLRVPVYSYVLEGIRFAFRSGRSVIANGNTAGNYLTAIGASELLYSHGMVESVLIVCPTSLKYQWKSELERCAGRSAVVIEGPHIGRRDRYHDRVVYKIVSYHTLANDVRAIGSQPFDCVIFDEVQRLSGWNRQISRALRHIEAEYCIALSGAGPESVPPDVFSRCRILSIPAGVIEKQLPERTDATLLLPMTREQQEIHRNAYAEASRLVGRWRSTRFLSEKERRRLLQSIIRMQLVSDSTFLVDRTGRHDTKIGEALDIVRAWRGKVAIFSRRERMTGLMAEELDRAEIKYEYIHGGMPRQRRITAAARFGNSRDCRVLLAADSGIADLTLGGIGLVVNLDQPWNTDAAEQRIGHVWRPGDGTRVRILHMLSAGSIEERVDAIARRGVSLPDYTEIQITIDDRGLDELASAFGPDEENGSPDYGEILSDGMRCVAALSEALSTPESAERLLDSIVSEDPATGRTELRIPVDSRSQVANILCSISKILGTIKR